MLPGLPGACLLWDGVGVCVACAAVWALRWPAGACVCAYSLRACLGCGICCRLGSFFRLFLGRCGGAIAAARWSWAGWIAGRACCRCWLPGVAGHVGGCARIVREGVPVVLWRGLWACRLWWIVCRLHWKITENLQKNSPEKCPRKNFFRNFPLWGNGLRREFSCKKGVDNITQQ